MCELQGHVWRVRQNQTPFSPIRILSRMQNIGNHLGYGRQEDAHEFMRWAFDHEVWRQPHQIAIIHLPHLTPLNIMRKTPWTDSRSDCEQDPSAKVVHFFITRIWWVQVCYPDLPLTLCSLHAWMALEGRMLWILLVNKLPLYTTYLVVIFNLRYAIFCAPIYAFGLEMLASRGAS
jgi:hypothetical protein